MHTKTELLELLRPGRLRLSKRLGQHYLIDPHIAGRLVDSCRLTRHDTVVEIGSGLGALTDLLAAAAKRVIAVEIDRAICQLLKARMAAHANVEVVCQDILEFPWARHAGSQVVGAVPYHITSPILSRLCEHSAAIAGAWLGLQQEVAERLCARPGTKAYGRLTLLVQYSFDVRSILRIPRGAFFPMPAVDSTWLQLAPHGAWAGRVKEESLLFDIVRVAFGQRRKTLVNRLSELTWPRLDRTQAAAVVRHAGLDERVRGEALSLEAFVELANALSERIPRSFDTLRIPPHGAPR